MNCPLRSYHSNLMLLMVIVPSFLLSACGGGGGDSSPQDEPVVTTSISGSGVKGPLANARVEVRDFAGAVIATATTGADAAISGLYLPNPLTPPYILEISATASTTDITTGSAPVITTLRNVITQAMLDAGNPMYATLLSTMVVDLAFANGDKASPYAGDANGTVTSAEFLSALPIAAAQVSSTLGFGIDSTIDLLITPPLLDATTDTPEKLAATAALRTANEALTAVIVNTAIASSGVNTDTLLTELVNDLADGSIDGVVNGQKSTVMTDSTPLFNSDPATMVIPGTTILIGDIEQLLADETVTTGSAADSTALTDGTVDVIVTPVVAMVAPTPDILSGGEFNRSAWNDGSVWQSSVIN